MMEQSFTSRAKKLNDPGSLKLLRDKLMLNRERARLSMGFRVFDFGKFCIFLDGLGTDVVLRLA